MANINLLTMKVTSDIHMKYDRYFCLDPLGTIKTKPKTTKKGHLELDP